MEKIVKYVQYVKGYMLQEDRNGIKELVPDYATETVENSFIQRYRKTFYALACVTEPCARNLMDFLVENMTYGNIVNSNVATRTAFNNAMYVAVGKKYSDVAVIKAFRQLRNKDLLLSTPDGVRGSYIVNPKYFWKNEYYQRIEKIDFILSLKRKGQVEMFIRAYGKEEVEDMVMRGEVTASVDAQKARRDEDINGDI